MECFFGSFVLWWRQSDLVEGRVVRIGLEVPAVRVRVRVRVRIRG